MASINYGAKEISVKVVYYGPGLSGKTTNLQVIHQKVPKENKSNMVSLATETDRTLFFDFLPLDLGKIKGFSTKFQLYTVPGQVYYNATRKLVLRGVDGVVFVVDSQPSKVDENLESFRNLLDNPNEYGYQIKSIPVVIQYNKRDVPDALPVEQLQQLINTYNFPWTEAVAVKGKGVFDTLKLIGKIVIDELNRKYSRAPGGAGAPAQRAPVAAAPAPRPMAAPRPPTPPPPPPPRSPIPQPMSTPQRPAAPQFRPAPPPAQPARPAPMPAPRPVAPAPAAMGDEDLFLSTPGRGAPAASALNRQPAFAPAPAAREQAPVQPPRRPPQQTPPSAPAPSSGYMDYNTVDLSPMGEESPRISADDTATAFPDPEMPVNKSELDLEIERYQREIEAKQTSPARAAPRAATAPAYAPFQPEAAPNDEYSTDEPFQLESAAPVDYAAPSQHETPSYEASVNTQDYDVYDPQGSQAGADAEVDISGIDPQQTASADPGDTDEAPLYFTSVNTADRNRRKVKRPVNPRERQVNKGILSKLFTKKESDE